MADDKDEPTAAVLVERPALLAALKFLKRYIRPQKPGEICLVFDNGVLLIQAGPVSARAPAEGTWPGTALCSGLVVLALIEGLPSTEQVSMQVDGDRLKVANFTFACRWETLREPPISVPLASSLNYVLSLRVRYTEDEIRRAGLIFMLRDAEKKRNKAIASAAKALAPLEISKDDLFEYLETRLRQQYVDEGQTIQDTEVKQPMSGPPTAKASTSG